MRAACDVDEKKPEHKKSSTQESSESGDFGYAHLRAIA
jgi:hypothetical protein